MLQHTYAEQLTLHLVIIRATEVFTWSLRPVGWLVWVAGAHLSGATPQLHHEEDPRVVETKCTKNVITRYSIDFCEVGVAVALTPPPI
jgi:hypothetical protein